jgi:hypothetical protein
VDEFRHPRYRDNEGSRFYKAGRLSPEETWRALGDELGRVLMDAQRVFWRGRLEMNPERVRWWHGAIFARHFLRRDAHRIREKARDMRYPQGMENGLHRSNGARDVARIARGDRLVDATPEAVREMAESAMLLSQGARRAIEMKRAANNGSTDPVVPANPAATEARPA